MSLEQAEKALIEKILNLDYVQDFQRAERALEADSSVNADYVRMKELQKEAVLYNKIDKPQAFKEVSRQSQILEKKLKNHPLVIDYHNKMQPVNSLLEYVTGQIEEQVNERLENHATED